MLHSLIIFDGWLIAFTKNANLVINEERFIQLLAPWYGIVKYYFAILACLQSTICNNNNATSMIKQKAALKAAQASKKVKYMDNSLIAKNVKITAL